MNFIAYSDESYSTERFRSIAAFSFSEKVYGYIRSELLNILKECLGNAWGQVLQSSISKKIMVDIIRFGVIHKKVGPILL